MTAKVLQLANSAFLGIPRRITTPGEAVAFLGVDAVRSLTLSASVFSQFRPKDLPGFSPEGLQEHSLRVASVASQIARSLAWPKSALNDTFVGGLLHDTGKLVLAQHCSDQYRNVLLRANREALSIREAERQEFGTTHAEVGGYLLWLWGIPDEITEVAALHHDLPANLHQLAGPVEAVHVADAIVNRRMDQDLNLERLAAVGWTRRLTDWREQSETSPS